MTARKLDKSQWRTFSTVSRKRSKESRPRSRLPSMITIFGLAAEPKLELEAIGIGPSKFA